MIRRLSILLVLVLFSSLSFAAVYKWTDKHGAVHYTQYKPTKYPFELVDAPPPVPSDVRDVNESAAEQIEERAEAERQEAEEFKVPEGDHNAQQCAIARENMKQLTSDSALQYTNEKGELVPLPDRDRAGRIRQTEKEIQFFCK